MRVFWVSALVVLAGCGGTVDHRAPASGPHDSGTLGGSGTDGAMVGSGAVGTGGSTNGASQHGGTGGSGSTGGSTVVAGAPPAAGQPGAGGQPEEACSGLACLDGAELLYHPNRNWQGTSSGAPGQELTEKDYAPLVGDPIPIFFAPGALELQMMPVKGTVVYGKRDPKRTDVAWFELDGGAGGRFVVKAQDDELDAEYTVYGSGRPVISSTRGTVDSPR